MDATESIVAIHDVGLERQRLVLVDFVAQKLTHGKLVAEIDFELASVFEANEVVVTQTFLILALVIISLNLANSLFTQLASLYSLQCLELRKNEGKLCELWLPSLLNFRSHLFKYRWLV